MRSIGWWGVWGLAVGVAAFGLKEAGNNSLHLIFSIPLLCAAIASAIIRLRYEYHMALHHAKWMMLTAPLFLIGMGYVYFKTEALGPFATGSRHKAFLGTRFEMSVPEVERTLGRRLTRLGIDNAPPDRLRDLILEMLPLREQRPETRFLPDLILYDMPGHAAFEFRRGRLATVRIDFQECRRRAAAELRWRIREDLGKDYQGVFVRKENGSAHPTKYPGVYRKEAVDATIVSSPRNSHRVQVSVLLQYLPLAETRSEPLRIEAKAF